MKKKIIAIILAVVLISAVAAGVVFGDDILAVITHREIVDAYDDYPLQTKERGNYILVSTRQEADDGVVVYSFVIKDKNSEEIVFKCPGAWRSWDLKYIGFIDDGLDILVASGDMGNTCYSYADGEWTEIYNPEKTDYSQLSEDKAVFISDDYQDYFDMIS
ncbi:MAG: hypothetical protein IJC13_00975 [Clostridia bacterium]|nr:hypothetical protein [Clostridia bacterium]